MIISIKRQVKLSFH